MAQNQVPKHDWFPGLSEKDRQKLLDITKASLKSMGVTDEELNWKEPGQEAKENSLKDLRDTLNNPGQKNMLGVVLDQLPNDFWLTWLAHRSKNPNTTLQEFIPTFLQTKISPAD